MKLAEAWVDPESQTMDSVGWLDRVGGRFSVKSAYELGVGDMENAVRGGWKLLRCFEDPTAS